MDIPQTFNQAMTQTQAARLIVALSGGLDSTVLARLTALWRMNMKSAPPVVLAHVNHGLRGEDADGDQEFCRELADELGMRFEAIAVDVRAARRDENVGLEVAGRRVRYRFFRELAGGDGLVLTGHHAGDQVETILMNLRRGAHARGLSGMRGLGVVTVPPDVRVRVCRPLLGVGKEELRAFALKRGWRWREDASNRELSFTRNRVRHRIVPALEKLMPGFSGRLLERARQLAVVEEERLARAGELKARTCRREQGGLFFEISDSALADAETLRYALREIMEEGAGARVADRRHLAALEALARGTAGAGTIALPRGLYARREAGGLFFFTNAGIEKDRDEIGVDGILLPEPPFSIEAFGMTVSAEWVPAGVPMPDGERRDDTIQWFNPLVLALPLRLRPPRPGERFRALGAPGGRKIQDILVDLKIPRRERVLPRVVADREGPLWIWPLRLAERARLPKPEGPALRMRISRK